MGTGFDASQHVAELQIELWRRMSPIEKLDLVNELTVATRELCLTGIRLRHAGASEREVKLRLALITLGRELALRAYPEAGPLDA